MPWRQLGTLIYRANCRRSMDIWQKNSGVEAFMVRRMILAACVLAAARPLARAVNEAAIQEMQQVIASDTRLSAERQASLQRIVSDVLGTGPELDEDKRLHASEHLKQYLDDYTPRAQRSTKLSELFEDKFRWDLGNYNTLAPITEQQRQAMRKLIQALADGIRLGIPAVYPDTPEPLRAELAKQVESAAQTLLESKRIGNYFYLQYLYPSLQDISPERVRDEWTQNPATAAEREKFAARLKAMQDAWDSGNSHQAQESTFVIYERAFLETQMSMLLVQHIDRTTLGPEHYAPMPKELENAYRELVAEMKQRTEESRAETNRLLKESKRLTEEADKEIARMEAARAKARSRAVGNGKSAAHTTHNSPASQPATRPANCATSQPRSQTQPAGAASAREKGTAP